MERISPAVFNVDVGIEIARKARECGELITAPMSQYIVEIRGKN